MAESTTDKKYYLDDAGLGILWAKIKSAYALNSDVVKGIQIQGNSITLTNGIANIQQFKGASSDGAGTAGVVPAPKMGEQDEFLRADGNWAYVKGTQVSTKNTLTEGTAIGTLTIDGKDITLYTPTIKVITGSGQGVVDQTSSQLTNGNVFLNTVDSNSGVTSSHKIYGSHYASVTTDNTGGIIIDVNIGSASVSGPGLMTASQVSKLNNTMSKTEIVSRIEGYGYQTQTQVKSLIANAQHMSKQVVDTLPDTGRDNVLYLVPNNSDITRNIYDEYMWISKGDSSNFEKIGSTSTDLSGYYNSSNFTPLDKTQIDNICTV